MICVTGAGGTVGSEVLNQLRSANTPVRVAYFSRGKADKARSNGIDAVVIDYNQPDTLTEAFDGCDKLFLLGRTITHAGLPPADLKGGMLAGSMPEELADRMLDLERYFREDSASGVGGDIKIATGNELRRVQDYVWEVAAKGVLNA